MLSAITEPRKHPTPQSRGLQMGVAGVACIIVASAGLIAAPQSSALPGSRFDVLKRGDTTTSSANGVQFRIRLASIECRRTFPGVGLDPRTYERTTARAERGKKLCLTTLAVRNIDRRPGFWYISFSDLNALKMSNGLSYAPWAKPYSSQTFARQRGVRDSSSTSFNPRTTAYDFILFEVPRQLRARSLAIPR